MYRNLYISPCSYFANHFFADTASRDAEVQKLDAAVREALKLPSDHRISYTDAYDALTTLKYHGKGWPEGMTEPLYKKIELEAVK